MQVNPWDYAELEFDIWKTVPTGVTLAVHFVALWSFKCNKKLKIKGTQTQSVKQ